MATASYQFPVLYAIPLECLCPSWPAYESRWTRPRKIGTFGSQAQAAAVQARARIPKRNQTCNQNKNDAPKNESQSSLPLEAAGIANLHLVSSSCSLTPHALADALARGNVARALRLRQRAQVEASLATASTSSSRSSVSTLSSPSSSNLPLFEDPCDEESPFISPSGSAGAQRSAPSQ